MIVLPLGASHGNPVRSAFFHTLRAVRMAVRGDFLYPEEPAMRSFSISEWCDMHGLSRAFYYILQARGEAPRTFPVGSRVRISEDANREWILAREAASNAVAA